MVSPYGLDLSIWNLRRGVRLGLSRRETMGGEP
jgi:hypothetical protein